MAFYEIFWLQLNIILQQVKNTFGPRLLTATLLSTVKLYAIAPLKQSRFKVVQMSEALLTSVK